MKQNINGLLVNGLEWFVFLQGVFKSVATKFLFGVGTNSNI